MPEQKFSASGRLIAFKPGDRLREYLIQEVRPWLDTYWYQADSPQGPVLIHESLAFLKPLWQQKVWDAQAREMAAQSLTTETEQWFQEEHQGLALTYRLYPLEVWELLQRPLASQVWQAGLLSESRIHQIYNWMRQVQRVLSREGWCNPSLVLATLVMDVDEQPICLEWNYAVPVNNELVYPRYYTGFHEASELVKSTCTLPQALCWSAIYSTLLCLLQGKPTSYWSPQVPDWKSMQMLLTREMRDWLEAFPGCVLPETWPDLPRRLFRADANLLAYRQASQHFQQGIDAYSQQNYELARLQALKACDRWLSDPWHWYLLARCEFHLQRFQAADQALSEALRKYPISVIWRERGKFALEQGHFDQAGQFLENALDLSSQDDSCWHLISLLHTRQHNPNKAIYAARQACRLRPLNTSYRQQLTTLLEQQNNAPAQKNPPIFAAGQTAKVSFNHHVEAFDNIKDLRGWTPLRELSRSRDEICRSFLVERDGQQALFKAYDFNSGWSAFEQEYRMVKRFKHPSLLKVLESWPEQGILVYEWVQAPTLQELLLQGALPGEEWLQVARQGQALLDYLKTISCAHGDLNPSNLIWDKQNRRLVLIDYEGVHDYRQKAVQTVAHSEYSPPEWLMRKESHVNTDRFGLAVVLIHAASGLFPSLGRNWKNKSFDQLEPYLLHLPADLRDALLNACRWDLRQRQHEPWVLPTSMRSVPETQKRLIKAVLALSETSQLEDFNRLSEQVLTLETTRLSYYHVAYHALRLGAYKQALIYAQHCLRIDSWHLGARWVMADALVALNNQPRALALLNEYLDLIPDQPETYRRMLQIYSQMGKQREAFAVLQHLERCLPQQPDVLLDKALLLQQVGAFAQAKQVLSDASIYKGSIQKKIQALEKHIDLQQRAQTHQ